MKLNIRDFTHYARFRGLPVYFNVETGNMAGRSWLADALLIPFAHIDNAIHAVISFLDPSYEAPGFAIELMGEIPLAS